MVEQLSPSSQEPSGSLAAIGLLHCPPVFPTPRPLLLRILGFVGLGLLVLLALVSSILWVLFHRPLWIDKIPDTEGRWMHELAERAYRARLRWQAADTNDNGVPDWYEVSQGVGPRSNPGASVSLCNISGRPWYVFLGERTRIRLMLGVNKYEDIRWPTNMEMQITAPGPILLAPGSPEGTPPTAGPLRVQVTPEGRLEFDVLRQRKEDAAQVKLTHARSGYAYNQTNGCVPFLVTHWRLPPVPNRVENRVVDISQYYWNGPVNIFGRESFGPPPPHLHLVWEPLPDPNTVYILQSARADAPDDWCAFEETKPGSPPAVIIGSRDRQPFPDYKGRLLYRVVPVSQEKPARP